MVQTTDGSSDEGSKKEIRKPRVKWVDVRVVCKRGDSALVQFVVKGIYHRVYIPPKKIVDGRVDESVLERGIVYGEPWEDFMDMNADKEQMANELRRRGMWVAEDVNPVTVAKVNKAFNESAFLKRCGEIVKGR